MTPNYETLLSKIGLDDKEAKVYLATLALRSAIASDIAKESGISRTTTYGILNELVQKGLVSKTEKSGVLKFNAENPELLESYIENKKTDLDLISKEIRAYLPDLKAMQKETEFKPQVEYFEGKEGIKAAYESVVKDYPRMAKEKSPLLIAGATQPLLDVWPDFPKYAQKRQRTGIQTKMLVWDKKIPQPMEKIQKEFYEIRFIPKKYAYFGGAYLMDDKFIFTDFDNWFCVVVKNKPLTQMMRTFFEFMWDNSK